MYRRDGGKTYALGFRQEFHLWAQAGYRPMGTVVFIRERMQVAQEKGVKEDSIPW